MLVRKGLHLLLLMLMNCRLSLTSQTFKRWLLPVLVSEMRSALTREQIAKLTCLSDKSMNHNSAKSALKTMSKMVQKTAKQWSNEALKQNVIREDKTKTAFHRLLCNLFEELCHGCELIHEVQAPQAVADLYQQKTILSAGTTRDWTKQLDHNKSWKVDMRH